MAAISVSPAVGPSAPRVATATYASRTLRLGTSRTDQFRRVTMRRVHYASRITHNDNQEGLASNSRLTQSQSSSNPTVKNAPNTAQNSAPNPTAAAELPPPSFHVDVAIAGGGLAGLALAAGLQARGVEAAVSRQRPRCDRATAPSSSSGRTAPPRSTESCPVDVSSPTDVSSSGESREAAVPELTALIDEVTGCSAIFITLKNGERFWQTRI
ncbi:unnamed protein product [Closterium sp. Naga37s-1]|nr:unnamed protein product [Closterium sp. Naga37s-1]